MSTAITWAIVLAYLAAGLAYTRSTIRRWARDPKSEANGADGVDRGAIAAAALLFGLLWPLTMAFQGLRTWLWKPTDDARERREQMQRDRDHWRTEARNATTEDARAAAKTIADTLTDLLDRP